MKLACLGMLLGLLAFPAKAHAVTFTANAGPWDPSNFAIVNQGDVVHYGSYHSYTIAGAAANQLYSLSYERSLTVDGLIQAGDAGNDIIQCDGNGDWDSGILGLDAYDIPALGGHTVSASSEFHDANNTATKASASGSSYFWVQ